MRKILLLLLIILKTTSYSQDGTIDTSFNPPVGANNNVNTTAIQADGKIIVGGDFTILNNIVCNRLSRLNADGTTDSTFNVGTGFNNTVYKICVQQDGKIVVCGLFTTYNGISTTRIVRLNIDGTIDSTFNIGIGGGGNALIYSSAIQADGKIIFVGEFTSFGGSPIRKIVRLNTNGTVDSTFNIFGANDTIYSCVLQSDGKIIVAGIFTSFNGVAKKGFARLNTDGTLDTTFNSNAATDGSASFLKICLQSDGKIILAGSFTTYDGTPANNIVRLNSDSTLDSTYNSGVGFNKYVKSILIQPDGKLIVSGAFSSYNGVSCSNLVRLNIDGSMDSTFNSSTDSPNYSFAIQTNGKILLGGNFTLCNNKSRSKIASINIDGSIDTSFYPYNQNRASLNGRDVYSFSFQSDGKIIIGGDFGSYNGIPCRNIARLNADGTLDTSFNSNGSGANNYLITTCVQQDGKILIGGTFTEYNGVSRNRIARLNADGSLDTTFNPDVNNFVESISIQPDGKIIICGRFFMVGGIRKLYLARLNIDGTIDSSFNTGGSGPDGLVAHATIQSDGKIIVGGVFFSYNGKPCIGTIRINANGTLDTTFKIDIPIDSLSSSSVCIIQSDGKIIINSDPYNNDNSRKISRLNDDGSLDTTFNCSTLTNGFRRIVIQKDGKIIIGGFFNPKNDFKGRNIMRLNTDGTLDNTFMSGFGFNAYVSGLAIQNDGKILVGGNFTNYNDVNINYIARLNNNPNTLSLEDFNKNNFEIKVYPNPAKDHLSINIPNGIKISSFEIFDIIGKKVDSNILNQNSIDINNYVQGIYFLNLKTDKGVIRRKFIKE